MDTSQLLSRARSGDPSAFEALISPHEDMVWRVCYRILQNHEDAQDAMQDAMLRAYRGIAQFRGDASLKTWLYQIAMSTATDLYRKRKIRLADSVDALQEESHDIPDSSPLPEDTIYRRQRQRAIRDAICALSDSLRMPLELFALEGMSYPEIAQHLGLPLGTVKSRIARARLAVQENLQIFEESAEPDRTSSVSKNERRTRA
ncbi:MAG: sigma-70 family RNA polymerase sigma factor [Clostridia bacterium]|nr:sigma-70 family RNA polymerase sigma factor [Clostridia bacterium]